MIEIYLSYISELEILIINVPARGISFDAFLVNGKIDPESITQYDHLLKYQDYWHKVDEGTDLYRQAKSAIAKWLI